MSNEPDWLEFFEDRERLYADYYLDFAQQHARRDPEAYEQLERESGNLLRVADWLGEQDQADGILQLAEALWQESDFMRSRGFMQRGLPLLERAWEAARRIGDSRAEFSCLEALANTHYAIGNHASALPLYEQSLTLADRLGDPHLKAHADLGMGWLQLDMGHSERAMSFLKQALKEYRQVQDYKGEITTLTALGNLLSLQDDAAEAIAYLEQGLRLAQAQQDRHSEMSLRFALGYVGTATKDWRLAIKHYEPVIAMARAIGDRFFEIRGLTNLGEAWLRLNDVPQAMRFLEEALVCQEIIDDVLTKAFTHLYLAKAYNILDSPNESLAHLEHVDPLSHVPVLFHEAAEAAWIKADNHLKKGDPELAISALQEVLKLAPDHMTDLRQATEILLQSLEKELNVG